MNNKTVYLHRRLSDNVVFYVGLGNSNRPYQKLLQQRTQEWRNEVNRYGYNVEILHTGLSEEEGANIEMDLIELIGRKDLGLGTLINKTNGGECPEGNPRFVIDMNTGTRYVSLVEACDDKGYVYSTVRSQLAPSGARVQYWNKLRYMDDLNCDESEFEVRKDSEILSKNVIDISTNIIYDSMKVACEDLGISYAVVRIQMCGVRRRKEWNTLYKLDSLIINNDGYRVA